MSKRIVDLGWSPERAATEAPQAQAGLYRRAAAAVLRDGATLGTVAVELYGDDTRRYRLNASALLALARKAGLLTKLGRGRWAKGPRYDD